MGKSILKDKSDAFAIEAVKAVQWIQKERKKYAGGKQKLRQGAAIGALIAEAEYGQSKAGSIQKRTILLSKPMKSIVG